MRPLRAWIGAFRGIPFYIQTRRALGRDGWDQQPGLKAWIVYLFWSLRFNAYGYGKLPPEAR